MNKYAGYSPQARQILQGQDRATVAILRYHIFKLLKGIIFLTIAYYIIFNDRATYFQSDTFKTDTANYLLSLNGLETFIFSIISFYVFLSWLLFGFSVGSAVWAAIITIIAECYYSWRINAELATSLGEVAYFMMGILGVYSFIAGVFNIRTFNIQAEHYRPYRPFLFQLINVIATSGDEQDSGKDYPYTNIQRLTQYVDAKIGARDNEAGINFLRDKKD